MCSAGPYCFAMSSLRGSIAGTMGCVERLMSIGGMRGGLTVYTSQRHVLIYIFVPEPTQLLTRCSSSLLTYVRCISKCKLGTEPRQLHRCSLAL